MRWKREGERKKKEREREREKKRKKEEFEIRSNTFLVESLQVVLDTC